MFDVALSTALWAVTETIGGMAISMLVLMLVLLNVQKFQLISLRETTDMLCLCLSLWLAGELGVGAG